MGPLLIDITQELNDLTWFVVAALGVLAVGAILVVLLLKFLKRLSK